MIDWYSLSCNGIWILGASIVLAAFSYHHWLSGETGRTLRRVFEERSWRLSFPTGMLLFCVGWLLAQSDRWWERALWGVLAASFLWQLAGVVSARRKGLLR